MNKTLLEKNNVIEQNFSKSADEITNNNTDNSINTKPLETD